MTSEKISQLQILQQNLQNVLAQEQQLENQMLELDSALTELKTTEKAYKIVGKIMIAASKDKMIKELNEKKEVVEIRLKNYSVQEERLKKSVEEAQAEVMDSLKGKKK